jgi:NRPS condensation-like uncharacterized protein
MSVSTPTIASVPLSVLDELFLGLDHREEPWNVHFEVRVGGRVDADRLADAICAAADRHPLARAALANWRLSDRGYRWEIADRLSDVPLDIATCADEAELAIARERLMGASPSLEAAPPFKLLLAHGPAGDSLVLNLHHAAGDGISAARLMRSILRAYAGEHDPLPPVDPLAVRDLAALAGAASRQDRRARRRALARQAARQWAPAARLAGDGGRDRPGYGFELHALTRAETAAVLARRTRGTTVNDVLLAALAVAIRRWNVAHGWRAGRITLTMPVNLRPDAWRTDVVGNFASYMTLSIGAADDRDVPRAIEVIGGQTRAIKRERLAGMIIDLLAGPSLMRIAAKRRLPNLIPLTGDVVVDTASLSNLGTVDPLPVEAVWFSPPGRMPLGAMLGAATLDGRLHLSLRYRHAQFDRGGAHAFARVYRDVLLA